MIRQLVHSSLEGTHAFVEPEISGTRNIYLQRRVFTKVKLGYFESILTRFLTNLSCKTKQLTIPASYSKVMILTTGYHQSQTNGESPTDSKQASA